MGNPGGEARAPNLRLNTLSPEETRFHDVYGETEFKVFTMLYQSSPRDSEVGRADGSWAVKPVRYGAHAVPAGQLGVPKCQNCPAPTMRLAGTAAGASTSPSWAL